MIETLLSIRHIFEPQNIAELGKVTAYFAFFGIIFAESGLFFGFFLPGDSLPLNFIGLLISFKITTPQPPEPSETLQEPSV